MTRPASSTTGRRLRRDRRGTRYVLVSAKDAPWHHGRDPWAIPAGKPKDAEARVTAYTDALVTHRVWLRRQLARDAGFLEELRGRDLACPCAPGVRCPTDILLEVLATTPAFRAEGPATR